MATSQTLSSTWLNGPITSQTSPFKTYTRTLYPENVEDVYRVANELWYHNGIYSSAIQKAVRYFITDVEILGGDVNYEARKEYLGYLTETYDIDTEAGLVGDDLIAFGNSFTSLHINFTRILSCPKCSYRGNAEQLLDEKYAKWGAFKFSGKCPLCNASITYIVKDIKASESDLEPHITQWPPQYMSINRHPISGRKVFNFDICSYTYLTEGIIKGDPLFILDTPWEMIEAIRDEKIIEFMEGELYHLALEPTASTASELHGWGLPKFMADVELAYLIMLLDKYVEVSITDHLMPFRLIAPPSTGNAQRGSGDILANINMGDFVSRATAMLEAHRKNPTGWNFMPFPVQYQELGGDAKNIMPIDILEHFENKLLYDMGIPQAFHNMSMPSNAVPLISFKMFEKTWASVAKKINYWLTWLTNKTGEYKQWKKVNTRFIPVSLFEDKDRQGMAIELANAQQLSKTTAFRGLGYNAEYEEDRIIEEQEQYQAKMEEQQAKMNAKGANMQAMTVPSPGEDILNAQAQQEQAMAQQGGGMPPQGAGGGMPPQQGGEIDTNTDGATLEELMNKAQEIAQQILTMDSSTRASQLISLKKQNPVLHAQVKSELSNLEQQAGQQGKVMARQGQL